MENKAGNENLEKRTDHIKLFAGMIPISFDVNNKEQYEAGLRLIINSGMVVYTGVKGLFQVFPTTLKKLDKSSIPYTAHYEML